MHKRLFIRLDLTNIIKSLVHRIRVQIRRVWRDPALVFLLRMGYSLPAIWGRWVS